MKHRVGPHCVLGKHGPALDLQGNVRSSEVEDQVGRRVTGLWARDLRPCCLKGVLQERDRVLFPGIHTRALRWGSVYGKPRTPNDLSVALTREQVDSARLAYDGWWDAAVEVDEAALLGSGVPSWTFSTDSWRSTRTASQRRSTKPGAAERRARNPDRPAEDSHVTPVEVAATMNTTVALAARLGTVTYSCSRPR